MTNIVPQIKPRELDFTKSPKVMLPVFELYFMKFIKAVAHLLKVGNVDIDIILINPF